MAGYRVVRLQAENVKKLQAVDITPEGDVVVIGGKNMAGKSSVLDAIFYAVGGLAVVPPRPVRNGEERATIKLGLGREPGEAEVIVVRTFDDDGSTSIRISTADGARYDKPQTLLDGLLGKIAMDPLEFARMRPGDQATELRRMVPLEVDLAALAKADTADTTARRDLNRDIKALAARIEAIAVMEGLPEQAPDKDAITAALAAAADTNTAIERERDRRTLRTQDAANARAGADNQEASAGDMRRRAAELITQAADLEGLAEGARERASEIDKEVAALPEIEAPVDTGALMADLAKADRILGLIRQRDARAELDAERATLQGDADAYTAAIAERAAQRAKALAEAKMPVAGLSFADVDGDQIVTLNGVPFEQASQAEQLRTSMAIAMAANPKLRVLRIRDGAFLDEDGLAIVKEIAKAGDFQVWLERVGGGDGVGIIIEDGKVRDAPTPESLADEGPKRRPKKEAAPVADGKPEGGLL